MTSGPTLGVWLCALRDSSARKAFAGDTNPGHACCDVLPANPDWLSCLRGSSHSCIGCFGAAIEKDPAHPASDIRRRLELDDIKQGAKYVAVTAKRPSRTLFSAAIASVAALVVAGLAFALWMSRGALPEIPPTEVRLEITAPPTRDFMSFAISPDGLQVVFAGDASPIPGLWIRELNAGTPRFLRRDSGRDSPFWHHTADRSGSSRQRAQADLI